MYIRLTSGQIEIICGFLANMAVAWFIAAFISSPSFTTIIVYTMYGVFALYGALYLKGEKYEF